ncbi:hypothetical protein FRC04_009932 [Tulasnella sp. 424]|nr:hypothetical protein FRC04_009932 [Tulasnella sp. 424]KAG8962482.1 hypothetical protein FRC05_005327 [Tulasnella sp. 425]
MAPTSIKRKRDLSADEDDSYVLPQRANFATFKEWIGMILLDCLERVQQATRDAKGVQMKKFHKKWEDAIAADKANSTKTTVSALEDLEEKMTLIKEVDLNQLAFSGLYKRLTKDSVLTGNVQVVEAIEEELPPSKRDRHHVPSKEEVDMNSLIMRTQLLLNELKASVTRLQTAISMEGSHPTGSQTLSARSHKPKKPVEQEEEWGGVQAVDSTRWLSQASSSGADSEAPSDELAFGAEEYSDADDDGWESGSVDSTGQVIPYSQRRIANSEDSDSDSSNVVRMDLSNLSDGDSENQEGLDMSSEDENPLAKRAKKELGPGSKSKGKAARARGENVFLPSLSVGFLPGDDDPNDDWKNFDVDGPPLKKNRPGQRARRALAEKKYGKRAKHLRNQAKDTDGRRTTPMTEKEKLKAQRLAKRKEKRKHEWEERKQALKSMVKTHTVRDDEFFVGGKSNQRDLTTLPRSKGAPPPRADDKRPKNNGKPRGKVDDKPLHPSWQAKQRLKQKEALGGARPQGKKIVFS